jgi:molybdate transport system substrate-binding protein
MIRTLYRQQAPGVSITLNLGASGILEQQIEQGAPVDIFISASPLEMDQLERKGLLINSTRRNLLRNTLVLICPASGPIVSGFPALAGGSVKRLAMANPESVPAGRYARQALEYFGIYKLVRPKIILTEDVRQALAYVETGNVDAGLVYLTEARLSKKVRVVATAPEASHPPILYPVAVLRRSSQAAAAAEAFIHFLMGPQARQAFEREGFVMAGR